MNRAQRYLACRPRRSESVPHRPCAICRVRPARFRFRGRIKADRSHTICMQCFRSMCDGLRQGRRRRRLYIRYCPGPATQPGVSLDCPSTHESSNGEHRSKR